MNRYKKIFLRLKKEGRIAFIPFWMMGDPNINESKKIIEFLAEEADVLELGFPFSDPLADGPTIQESVNNALRDNITTSKCFDIVRSIRRDYPDKAIGLLVYFNLILSFGVDKFFRELNRAGVDSIIIPELPPEEIDSKIESEFSLLELSKKNNVSLVFLPSTNISQRRLEKITKSSEGFVYAVSSPSTTGGKIDFTQELSNLIMRIKKLKDIPVYVGFGVSSPDDIKKLKDIGADGAIIASKIIKIYRKDEIEKAKEFVRKCKKST